MSKRSAIGDKLYRIVWVNYRPVVEHGTVTKIHGGTGNPLRLFSSLHEKEVAVRQRDHWDHTIHEAFATDIKDTAQRMVYSPWYPQPTIPPWQGFRMMCQVRRLYAKWIRASGWRRGDLP